jgi:stromal membrane-associated protein
MIILCVCRDECTICNSSVFFIHFLTYGFYDTGVFMGPTNIPFTSQAPAAFQGFPSMGVPVPATPALMGNVMGPSTSMMVGMPMPNGFMGNAQTGMMPLPQNVGPQGGMVGQMGAPQSKFGLPQAQQPQWSLSQVGSFIL